MLIYQPETFRGCCYATITTSGMTIAVSAVGLCVQRLTVGSGARIRTAFITNGETLADHSNAAKLHREALEQGLINAAEVEEWDRNTHRVLPKDINDGPRMGDWFDFPPYEPDAGNPPF